LNLLALPREATEPRRINDLTDGLGKNGVIELQGVLRPAPKPSRLRRSLAQTASCVAAATIGTMLLTSHAMAGGFWRQSADGWIYVPDELLIVFIGAVVAAVAVIAVACSDQSKPSATFSEYLPEEVRAPESVEYYDDMTARTRGLKRQLDADTELAESYIKARRAKAELEDLDSEARRHARGRQ
jgi:hypothetical protein